MHALKINIIEWIHVLKILKHFFSLLSLQNSFQMNHSTSILTIFRHLFIKAQFGNFRLKIILVYAQVYVTLLV